MNRQEKNYQAAKQSEALAWRRLMRATQDAKNAIALAALRKLRWEQTKRELDRADKER
jgi:hypothetical protein